MSEEPDPDQLTIEDYDQFQKDRENWQCRVCEFESETKELVENCHPEQRLEHERQSAVTEATDSHTGFVFPPQLYPEVREFLSDVEAALQATDHSNPLPIASDVIAEYVSGNPFESRAFQLFTHLVFLQQYRVLPGYPYSVPTREEAPIRIREFCTMTDRFRGTVSREIIEKSNAIRTEEVYRSRVYSTTEDFAARSEVLPNKSRWQWTTQCYEAELLMNVIFDEGTAHNALVARSRNWIATHPVIDWACAPHVMGDPIGTQAESRFSDQSTDSDPPEGPVQMFDFAGFSEQDHPRLTVTGFVINEESGIQIQEQISRAMDAGAPVIIVLPTRKSIEEFIACIYSQGWYGSDPAQLDDDVIAHYRAQPSIPEINSEFTNQLGVKKLRVASRKQLIDDIIDPEEVFPDSVLRPDEEPSDETTD
ncbi:hypothetical protein [Halosimplex pelagicum]|uniref:Uncharacterized protein n=1 Tax=Halosimplex pelagicum TaxID=869886 RepID=A0A7D5PGF4_9EURY|nr:hypothetical protein [Halosimplex pelagicum]QLH83839.1 hypothetical protein HZS54_20360 [Halosimplex pelagicum]